MKKICLFFFSLVICTSCFAALSEAEKLASLCRVWGFLKYYHPALAKGKKDWDKEFMNKVGAVCAARDKDELNTIYISWITSLGEVETLRHAPEHVKDTNDKNYDNLWMSDHAVFSDSLIGMLHHIERNKTGKRNYYIRRHFPQMHQSFRNENEHKDSIMPSVNMRLLTLARYWNIIQYYYPYKYVIDTPWARVLDKMLPAFMEATDSESYVRSLRMMVTHINDSHGYLKVPEGMFGANQAKTIPVGYYTFSDKAIVTFRYNDSLAALDDIRYGDAILAVDGKSVKEIVACQSKYLPASNEPTMLNRFSRMNRLAYGYTDTVRIVIERNGSVFEKTVHRYFFSDMHFSPPKNEPRPYYKQLESNIGYVDMGILRRRNVKSVMRKAKHTDALILDVRAYPNMTMYLLARYLNGGRKKFVRFTIPDWRYPGHFYLKNYYSAGRSWHKGYGGKVILLINETTQSHAEFTCMALRQGAHVTCIGSQTAGADGDMANIYLPGGYETAISGLGIYYPDGSPTQRVGIIPDIEVRRTVEGIRAKNDEVLERAIQFAKTGK